jgi:PKD repeat protein
MTSTSGTTYDWYFADGISSVRPNTSKNSNTYLWDFGDGLNSNSAATTVTHDYIGAGPFIVKLKATGTGGTNSCKTTLNF